MPSNIPSFDFIECHVCKGLGSPFYNYKMLGSNPFAENQGGCICHVCLQVYTACHLDTVHGWSDHISLIYKFMAIRDGTHHGSCFKKPISYFLRSWFWQRCRNSCPSENIPLSLYVLFI